MQMQLGGPLGDKRNASTASSSSSAAGPPMVVSAFSNLVPRSKKKDNKRPTV